MADAVRVYIEKFSPITHELEGRITVIDTHEEFITDLYCHGSFTNNISSWLILLTLALILSKHL